MRRSLALAAALFLLFLLPALPCWAEPGDEAGATATQTPAPDGSTTVTQTPVDPESIHVPDTSGKVGGLESNARSTRTGVVGLQLVSIAELASGGTDSDDGKYQFSGEVVGDILDAGAGYMWVTVSDGDNALSIYMKDSDAALVQRLGGYGVEGTTLLISGTFHLSCDVHDGETDIHASSASVLRSGFEREETVDPARLRVAIGLLAAAALLIFINWRLRERLR